MADHGTGPESRRTMIGAITLRARPLVTCLVVLLVELAAVPVPVRAGGALFGGWEGDGLQQGYAYSAAGSRWPNSSPLGVSGRLQASYLYYRFTETGGLTRVWSPGLALLLGPSASGARGSTSLLAGLDLRKER